MVDVHAGYRSCIYSDELKYVVQWCSKDFLNFKIFYCRYQISVDVSLYFKMPYMDNFFEGIILQEGQAGNKTS